MKGLLYKDFALVGRQGKFFIVYILVFSLVFSSVGGGAGAANTFMTVICFMLSLNCFAYDEQCRFDKLTAAAPVPAARVVLARYLSALCLGLFGCLLTAGVGSIVQLVRGQTAFHGMIGYIGIGVALSLFLMTVLFPLFFKFGANKSRILMFVILALPAAAIPALSQLFPHMWDLSAAFWSLAPWIAAAALLLALAVSVCVSCRILRNKQY